MAGATGSEVKAVNDSMMFVLRKSDMVVTLQAAKTRRDRKCSEGNYRMS